MTPLNRKHKCLPPDLYMKSVQFLLASPLVFKEKQGLFKLIPSGFRTNLYLDVPVKSLPLPYLNTVNLLS